MAKSVVIAIDTVSVQNLLVPFRCVLEKDTLCHFPLLGGLSKPFSVIDMAVVQEKKDKVRPVLDFRELNEFVECSGADADACDEKLRSWRQKSANCALLDLRNAFMQISVVDECSKYQI